MPVVISSEQRDALYDQILVRLSGIEDIWVAASSENYETADRLGREYSDELRLVLDDLGWGNGPELKTMIELTTEPDVLRRVLGRLGEAAAAEREYRQSAWVENRKLEERNRLVGETCRLVLTALDAEERP